MVPRLSFETIWIPQAKREKEREKRHKTSEGERASAERARIVMVRAICSLFPFPFFLDPLRSAFSLRPNFAGRS